MAEDGPTPETGGRIHFESGEFDSVKAEEFRRLGLDPEQDGVFGLALSGGGIRSASFALGVLQALHGYKVFNRFDYLSTVSGGGYIGSALTYFRNYFARNFDSGWFPFGYLNADPKLRAIGVRTAKPTNVADLCAYQIVSYLRQHASFLTPSRMLDRPALAAGVLRGLISSVLPYMALLVGMLGACIAVGIFDDRLRFGGWSDSIALNALAAGDKGEKSPYLALWPAGAALALLAIILLGGLFQVLRSSHAFRGEEDIRKSLQGYYTGITWMHRHGNLLLFAAGLLLLAILPWLHDYLAGLGKGQLPTTFGALLAALAGAAAQVTKLRAIIGGDVKPPSAIKSALMVVGGIALVFGVILLAYIVGFQIAAVSRSLLLGWGLGSVSWIPVPGPVAAFIGPLLVGALGLLLALNININHTSQHRLYRDRLMEVFCADEDALEKCAWRAARWAQTEEGYLQAMKAVPRPLHLISTTMIASDSDDRRFRGRGGDNFLLSPVFCGSDATGWVKTEIGMKALSLPTAAAISGAALNAHAGPHGSGGLRNKAYAALLSFLGLNLGYWARNPRAYAGQNATPKFRMPHLLAPGWRSLSGRHLHERGPYVLLSDGGHFENLAIYELIRRQVRLLWVSDAGQDTGFSFEDLSCAIERVRVDFGVNIRFVDDEYDLVHLMPGSSDAKGRASENFADRYNLARRGYAIGRIEYPDRTDGIFIYVKSTLTRSLPGDIYGYKARNKHFPHQTTLDQFFDEEQFEAYRELGYRLSKQLFTDIRAARAATNTPNGSTGSKALDKVAAALGL